MALIQDRDGYGPRHVVQALPWQDLGVKLFVDVGGSYGSLAVAFAQRFDNIRFIVQDLPEIISDGLSHIPSELLHRIEFMTHDFFTEQPIKGADVYHFRWIFHNWSDKYCVEILQNLIPALKNGARIVISEFVIPSHGEVSLQREWLSR